MILTFDYDSDYLYPFPPCWIHAIVVMLFSIVYMMKIIDLISSAWRVNSHENSLFPLIRLFGPWFC
jgi:hypothetical protein